MGVKDAKDRIINIRIQIFLIKHKFYYAIKITKLESKNYYFINPSLISCIFAYALLKSSLWTIKSYVVTL